VRWEEKFNPKVTAAVEQYGFYPTETGGGCTAYARDLSGDTGFGKSYRYGEYGYLLLTVPDSPEAPTRMRGEAVLLGIYRSGSGGEASMQLVFPSLTSLLTALVKGESH